MGKQRAVHIGGKSLQVLLGGFCFSSFCGCLIGVALYGQTGRLCYPRFRGYMLSWLAASEATPGLSVCGVAQAKCGRLAGT